MSAEVLREAARLMRDRAEAATDGGHGWHVTHELAGANEVWATRDAAGWDAFMVAITATRLNPNPGAQGHADAEHIASWHPAVALAVADLLENEASLIDGATTHPDLHMPLNSARTDCLLAVARAYLGESA